MISYSEREVFSKEELALLQRAQVLIDHVHHEVDGDEIRCHELARATGSVLGLECCDGWYGMVSHSWLWTTAPERVDGHPNIFHPPNILDVYVVGRLPQVQLVRSSSALPYEYRRGDPRQDIRGDIVAMLLTKFAWCPRPT